MTLHLISFTPKGQALGERLARELEEAVHIPFCVLELPLRDWVKARFLPGEGLVFIGAAGIAVRSVAPFVQSKLTDPAVVALDQEGRYVIPLLAGHVGGANRLARRIAALTGGQAVITTATDLNGVFAVDTWAVSQGLQIANPERIKAVSGLLLAGETVAIGSLSPVEGLAPEGVLLADWAPGRDVLIGQLRPPDHRALHLVAPVITAGVGCRKGSGKEDILAALADALKERDIHPLALGRVCSIDLKKEEPGLLAACKELGVSLETFSPEELWALGGAFTASPFVEEVTGVDNVCERSALLGSRGGVLIAGKRSPRPGITVALALAPCRLRFEEEL